MANRITISIPDKMAEKLIDLKDELVVTHGNNKAINRKISHVCQEALEKIIKEAEVSRIYRKEGIKDGEIAAQALLPRDKQFIVKVFSAQGPYKKWSRFQRVTVLNEHFSSDPIHKVLTPRFIDLMKEGGICFDDWVEIDSPTNPYQAEDRRGEMSWSYIEGCFEGVALAASKEMKEMVIYEYDQAR